MDRARVTWVEETALTRPLDADRFNSGITQARHDEVAPSGIRTLIVEPGAFRTGLFRPDAALDICTITPPP